MGKKLTLEQFIYRSNRVHNFQYDYSKVIYFNNYTKVTIGCKHHGLFTQVPKDHLKGRGCFDCSKKYIADLQLCNRNTTENFIKNAINIHGNRYNYDKTIYISVKTKVIITCSIHGDFLQAPWHHLNGHNCMQCSLMGGRTTSLYEVEIAKYLESLGYKVVLNTRKIIKPYELDIYLPELNKAIEFNGLYWHYSKTYFKKGKHAMKSNMCRDKEIKLLHVREDLWLRDVDRYKEIIKLFLDKN